MNKQHDGRDGLAVKWAEVRAAHRAGIIAFSDIVDAYVSGFDAATEIDQKRIERLESELSTQVDLIACGNCEEVERRMEKLREALRFYSVASNYVGGIETDETGVIFVGIRVAEDRGRRARAALQEETK